LAGTLPACARLTLGTSAAAATPMKTSRVSQCQRGVGAESEVVLASWQRRIIR
jgi:hypothetical protein